MTPALSLTQIFGTARYAAMPVVHTEVGATDYLDIASMGEFPKSVTFLRGVDHYKRAFVRFAVRLEHGDADDVGIYTCFERYTGGSMLVMCPAHGTGSTRLEHAMHEVFQFSTRMTPEAELALQQLAEHGEVAKNDLAIKLVTH